MQGKRRRINANNAFLIALNLLKNWGSNFRAQKASLYIRTQKGLEFPSSLPNAEDSAPYLCFAQSVWLFAWLVQPKWLNLLISRTEHTLQINRVPIGYSDHISISLEYLWFTKLPNLWRQTTNYPIGRKSQAEYHKAPYLPLNFPSVYKWPFWRDSQRCGSLCRWY